MSTLTANYSLTKPADGENYDVTIVNANNDIIDTELKARADEATALDARLDTLETTAPPTTALTLGANFQRYNNSADYTPAYRQFVGGKRVELEGIIWRITSALAYTANTGISSVLATLPVGIRPPRPVILPIVCGIGTTRGGQINVNADGTVIFTVSATGSWAAANTTDYVSLDGVGWWL